MAEWAKNMLNTHLQHPQKNVKNTQLLFTINIQAENNAEFMISFYEAEQKYYVAYNFVNTGSDETLQKFAIYANGIFYEISSADMEKLKNVATNIIKS